MKKKFVLFGAGGYVAPKHLKAIKDTNNELVASYDVADSVGILDSYFPNAKFFTDESKIVRFIEDKNEIEILAIGIGHDVSRYYNRAIKITDVNELGDVMISQLSALFDKKNKLH